MRAPAVLADINVWLATVVESHPHHTRATRWWREEVLPSRGTVAFCRLTVLGLLRLLANETVMGSAKLTALQSWDAYRQIRSQESVLFRAEPDGVEDAMHRYAQDGVAAPGFWTDAYLAAFAEHGKLTLATFDQGFRRFRGLRLALLEC